MFITSLIKKEVDTVILNNVSNLIIENLQLQKQLKKQTISTYEYNNELIKSKLNLNNFLIILNYLVIILY